MWRRWIFDTPVWYDLSSIDVATAGMGGEYSRGETLLLFIPKDTVMLFPTWASIVLLVIGMAIVGKSAVEHRG